MTGVFATRVARRRAVTYVALLATSLLLIAISANPLVQDLQSGMQYAVKPIQGAVDGVVRGFRSIGTAISDIDRLRIENDKLHFSQGGARITEAHPRESPSGRSSARE